MPAEILCDGVVEVERSTQQRVRCPSCQETVRRAGLLPELYSSCVAWLDTDVGSLSLVLCSRDSAVARRLSLLSEELEQAALHPIVVQAEELKQRLRAELGGAVRLGVGVT